MDLISGIHPSVAIGIAILTALYVGAALLGKRRVALRELVVVRRGPRSHGIHFGPG